MTTSSRMRKRRLLREGIEMLMVTGKWYLVTVLYGSAANRHRNCSGCPPLLGKSGLINGPEVKENRSPRSLWRYHVPFSYLFRKGQGIILLPPGGEVRC